MVQRRSGKRGKLKLLGNHQRCWVWGRNAVGETLKCGRWPIIELYVDPDVLTELTWDLPARCRQLEVPWESCSSERLSELCHAADHQGLVARMSEFPYAETSELERAVEEGATILVCDRIQDPFNFGALLRSAEAFGVRHVLIEQQRQVGVTSHVARCSAGAVNYLEIVRTKELAASLKWLAQLGTRVVVTAADAGQSLEQTEWIAPLALVLGNEGSGVRPEIQQLADDVIAIPITGQTESLNAAIAGSIALYHATRAGYRRDQ